jgi:hypothetical protein
MNFNVAAMYNLVTTRLPPGMLENILSNPNILDVINQRETSYPQNLQNMFQALSQPIGSQILTEEQTETKNRILETLQDPSRFIDVPDFLISAEEVKSAVGITGNLIQQFVQSNNQDNVISNILRFLQTNPDPHQQGVSQEIKNALERLYIDKDTSMECSICLSTRESRMFIKLKCCHIFDEECILTWFSQRNTCPMCRSSDLI